MQPNLNRFLGRPPYATQLFGIYQPLLGWRSKRTTARVNRGFDLVRDSAYEYLTSRLQPHFRAEHANQEVKILELKAATPFPRGCPTTHRTTGSFLINEIRSDASARGLNLARDSDLAQATSREAIEGFLKRVSVLPSAHWADRARTQQASLGADTWDQAVEMIVAQESTIAGLLIQLSEHQLLRDLRRILIAPPARANLDQYAALSRSLDPLAAFDPKKDFDRASLSPIALLHVFRHYYFQLDTFLGDPVEHIWLAPGSVLELIEAHSRRTVAERTSETLFEQTDQREASLSSEEELSERIATESQNNTKFGASVTTGGTYSGLVYSAHVEATACYNLESNVKSAREDHHQAKRQQTSKMASQIRQSYKTTIRTSVDTQDSNSRRYVVQNNGTGIINYELRRKMRQVGVQVQDLGTQLCWQTYVDLPGDNLGIASLVHLAEPPDLTKVRQPEHLPLPQPQDKTVQKAIPFPKIAGADNDEGQTYISPSSTSEFAYVDNGLGDRNADKIRASFSDNHAPPLSGYELDRVELSGVAGGKLDVTFTITDRRGFTYFYHIDTARFDQTVIDAQFKFYYLPTRDATDAVVAENGTRDKAFSDEKLAASKAAFIKAARDRIKAAGSILQRSAEELREEERVVVYRALLKQLTSVGPDMSEPRIRHIMAELINSLFDVDKMLYFVAPDWWVPRDRRDMIGQQDLGEKPKDIFDETDIVSWGGIKGALPGRPNYYITEDSKPARLGSSIGWLLQLDGDNMRNAFLNAPWVKAVVPIRAGRETAALNWLQQAHVEGSDVLDTADYVSNDPETEIPELVARLAAEHWESDELTRRYQGWSDDLRNGTTVAVKLRDALRYLALRVRDKSVNSKQKVTQGAGEGGYLATERVFEYGFEPLKGGFKAGAGAFEVFDQWIEVVPTTQIAAVEVKYDPKTGELI